MNRSKAALVALIVLGVAVLCGSAVAQSRIRPPDAVTGPVKFGDLESHAVLLEAIIYPKGHYAWYWFQVGTTDRYGRTTERHVDEGQGVYGTETTDVFLCQFRPHTTYHYRLVVKNQSGKGYGRDRTFRTGRHHSSKPCF